MKTILRGRTNEVTVDIERPVTIIGEKINPTGRKKLASALEQGDLEAVRTLARAQIACGADVLDVNVGIPGVNEAHLMDMVIKDLAEWVDVPFCIDSSCPEALEAGLRAAPGKPLVNSVTAEEKSLRRILPIVKEHRAAVIGLIMNDNGIPSTPEGRLESAELILDRAVQLGIPQEDVIIDPLVMAVSSNHLAGQVTLTTVRLVQEKLCANMIIGASNVSHGLPDRHTANMAFMALALQAGVTCTITDPNKMALLIRGIDLMLGRDEYGIAYVRAFRKLQAAQAQQTS